LKYDPKSLKSNCKIYK